MLPEPLAAEVRKLPEHARARVLEGLARFEDPELVLPAPKLVEPADARRIASWLGDELVLRLHLPLLRIRLATLNGALDSVGSPLRHEALRALEQQFGETRSSAELRAIVRWHLQFRRRLELLMRRRSKPRILAYERMEIEGFEHLDEALAHGRGALLVTAYYGYGRLIKPILRSRGYGALLVGQPRGVQFRPPPTRLARFVSERVPDRPPEPWVRLLGEDVQAGMNLRPHVAALARNEVIVIVADAHTANALWRVPVLGADVYFAPGPVSIGRASGAAVLPAFVVDEPERKGASAFRLVILPPLELQITGDAKSDMSANVRRFAAAFEPMIERQPHLWWQWTGMRSSPRWFEQRRKAGHARHAVHDVVPGPDERDRGALSAPASGDADLGS